MKALLFWTLSRAGVTHQHRRAGRRGVPLLPATAEADPINFAPRVKIPVLMINGRHDFAEPVDKTQKPMFRWFGTPEKDGPQRRRPLLWLPGRDRNAGVCHGRDRPSPCRPRPGSDFSSYGPSSATVLSATAAAMSGGAFRISRFLRADPHFPCLLKITIFIQRGAAAGMKTSYENSRRYLSYCAFISAMNWMNSGACRMRFKKASCSNKG